MGKSILSQDEFGKLVASRFQEVRPEAEALSLGQLFLMVVEGGRRRVLSLASYYQRYSQAPERCEVLIEMFLRQTARENRRRTPTLLELREKILPQVVPLALVEQTRRDGRELAAVRYVGDLAIAFVIDEEERFTYIHRKLMLKWEVRETDLLALAVRNLQAMSKELAPPLRIGSGKRQCLIWQAYDGYDATRILLTRSLLEMAAHVEGNPVIAVPHRHYMVMFGDSDPAFVEEMMDRVRDEASHHRYPISERLYTLNYGTVTLYDWNLRRERVFN